MRLLMADRNERVGQIYKQKYLLLGGFTSANMSLYTSLLSAIDLSTDATSIAFSRIICPHCSHPSPSAPPIEPKLADALKEAQLKITALEADAQKSQKCYNKRVEKVKEKCVRLFAENQKLGKETYELKDNLKKTQEKAKQLQVLLGILKKQNLNWYKEQPHIINRATSDAPPIKTTTVNQQHYKVYKDRSVYIGQMANGVPHGKGKLFYKVGLIYEGEFKNHRLQGFGTMRDLITNQFYQGQWKNGKRNGKGLKILGHIRYEGEFKQDLAEGLGQGIDLKTGNKYVGQWKNNMFDG